MKKSFVLMLLVSFAAFPGAAQAPNLGKLDIVERSVPAGPVALINGTAIEGSYFLEEYRRQVHQVAAMLGEENPSDELRIHTGLSILGELLREEILIQEAARRNIQVDSKTVEKEYQEKLKSFMEFVEETGGEKLGETQVLERAGQSREEAFNSVRRQLIAEQMVEILAKESNVSVSDTEVRKFYDDNPTVFQVPGSIHLKQILIEPKPNAMKADDQAWKKAEEQIQLAKSRIEAGEEFAAVARSVSEAPDAEKGGDMGMMPVSMLPPFFVEASQALKPRELSNPIRSQYGMHLVQLVETEAQHSLSFEDARDRIRERMKGAKMEDAVLEFCEPIINDGSRTQIFLQLERSLATLKKEE
ncbi:MAG: hypothetical protein GX130_02280 [Candidatus Hydrogenedens sp.]|jgi:parvulin-like peptidyl-prolyl isomerase|nr:hypothetical protein [Candidatus Hydrogenedens sp.]